MRCLRWSTASPIDRVNQVSTKQPTNVTKTMMMSCCLRSAEAEGLLETIVTKTFFKAPTYLDYISKLVPTRWCFSNQLIHFFFWRLHPLRLLLTQTLGSTDREMKIIESLLFFTFLRCKKKNAWKSLPSQQQQNDTNIQNEMMMMNWLL